MDIRNYDPGESIEYMELVSEFIRIFPDAQSVAEVVDDFGADTLRDITSVKEFRALKRGELEHPGLTYSYFQFQDLPRGRGMVEVAFLDNSLANVRAQFFFEGFRAKNKAKKYLQEVLLINLEQMFGPAQRQAAFQSTFAGRRKSRGLVCVARYVPGTNSVSAHITDSAMT